MMIDQRLSTGDPRVDAMADEHDQELQWRRIFERGGNQADYQWCTARRVMRRRADPVCSGCVGADPRNAQCWPERRY